MTTLTDLRALALAAITHEPSDHGKLSAVRMRVWQEALDDFHDEAHPERVLQLLDVIEAAKAVAASAHSHADEGPCIKCNGEVVLDAALAELEKQT